MPETPLNLLTALQPLIRTVQVNDGDTLSSISSDETVIWTATGSWSAPAQLTLGDLRAICSAAKAEPETISVELKLADALHTLQRLAEATPQSTNSADARSMASYMHAVAASALDRLKNTEDSDNMTIPCDIRLPDVIFRKGVNLSTMLAAIERYRAVDTTKLPDLHFDRGYLRRAIEQDAVPEPAEPAFRLDFSVSSVREALDDLATAYAGLIEACNGDTERVNADNLLVGSLLPGFSDALARAKNVLTRIAVPEPVGVNGDDVVANLETELAELCDAHWSAGFDQAHIGRIATGMKHKRAQFLAFVKRTITSLTSHAEKAESDARLDREQTEAWYATEEINQRLIIDIEKVKAERDEIRASVHRLVTTCHSLQEQNKALRVQAQKEVKEDEWEYETTSGMRKSWDGHQPEGEGWEPDYSRGRPGEAWERFDFHEEMYWKRRKVSTQPAEAEESNVEGEIDLEALNEWFSKIPLGPYNALVDTARWEIRAVDTDPTNKHHYPHRLGQSIPGQRSSSDTAVANFIAGILNTWPIIHARLTESNKDWAELARSELRTETLERENARLLAQIVLERAEVLRLRETAQENESWAQSEQDGRHDAERETADAQAKLVEYEAALQPFADVPPWSDPETRLLVTVVESGPYHLQQKHFDQVRTVLRTRVLEVHYD